MFRKVLIANRGEIAVRIIRTCHDLGIKTVAIYEAEDRDSLHVHLADECVLLKSVSAFQDQQAIINIAKETKVDAIHPGYSYLTEQKDFVRACEASGIKFVGPSSEVLSQLDDRLEVLKRVKEQGIPTPIFSMDYPVDNSDGLLSEAECIGFPIILKLNRLSTNRNAWILNTPQQLNELVKRLQREYVPNNGYRSFYFEKAIQPAKQVVVQVLGDQFGNLIHLGERDVSLQYGGHTLVEESPCPGLAQVQREQLWEEAVEISRLFHFHNAGTVEFLIDENGAFYFTEIQAGLLAGHPVTEILTRVDIVAEQFRVAAGEALELKQSEIQIHGWAMQCRINAVDPSQNFLPCPGHIQKVRFPGGPFVRVDAYIESDSDMLARYDPILAKLVVWGLDREECIFRIRRALRELHIRGTSTDLSLHESILRDHGFFNGTYSTDFLPGLISKEAEISSPVENDNYYRDLAIATAIMYLRRKMDFKPVIPERLLSGWHRHNRCLHRSLSYLKDG